MVLGAAPQLLLSFTTLPRASRHWWRGDIVGKVHAGGERVTHTLKLVQVERLLLTYPRSAAGNGRCFVQGLGAARPATWPVVAGTGAAAAGVPARRPSTASQHRVPARRPSAASQRGPSREPGQGTHGQSSGLKGWADASGLILLLIEGLLE